MRPDHDGSHGVNWSDTQHHLNKRQHQAQMHNLVNKRKPDTSSLFNKTRVRFLTVCLVLLMGLFILSSNTTQAQDAYAFTSGATADEYTMLLDLKLGYYYYLVENYEVFVTYYEDAVYILETLYPQMIDKYGYVYDYLAESQRALEASQGIILNRSDPQN